MSNGKRILTVSYGTFSCSLEGFDDAFSTMKAIAEYFRELSAQDRYFGAIPPVPDARKLESIAESEMRRHVEARVADSGVVLRPGAGEQAPERSGEGAEAAAEMQPGKSSASSVAAAASSGPPGESVAARLARIRAMVARNKSGEEPAESIFSEDEQIGNGPAHTALHRPDASPKARDAPDLDAVAPPVAKSDSDASAVAGRGEPDAAQDNVADTKTESNEGARLTESVAEHPKLPEPAEVPEMAIAGDTQEERPANSRAEVPSAAPAQDRKAAPFLLTGHLLPRAMAQGTGGNDPKPPAEPPSLPATPDRAATPSTTPPASASADAGSEGPGLGEAPEPQADVRGSGRLFRNKSYGLKPKTPVAPQFRRPALQGPSLSVEDQLRNLLGLRPAAEPAAAEPDTATAEPAEPQTRDGRSILETAKKDDRALDRLVEDTNSHFEGADNKRRHSAISHLKAAVAATQAERDYGSTGTGDDDGEPTPLERYREDLSRVVPAGKAKAANAPESRSEPFVLGNSDMVANPAAPASETLPEKAIQRVLAEISGNSLPEGDHADDPDNDGHEGASEPPSISFQDFVETVAPSDLSDLLEAAAAYLAVIEQRKHFSRPQIMRKLATVPEQDRFSREDGLRSFGALIRQGRIQKLNRGQFTISKNSRFTTQAMGATQ